MKIEDRRKLYQLLGGPFPDEAIERTNGRATGRGYDTTGIKAQYVINRLNEVLGVGGWRTHREITVKEITSPNGRKGYEAHCDLVLELGEWIDGKFVPFAEALADGGHVSYGSEADCRKAAYSNALKKGAAMFGCGRQAYEGSIDEDNLPVDPSEPVGSREAARSSSNPTSSPNAFPVQRPTTQTQPSRNRISSKQLAAIHSLARKCGIDAANLRAQTKNQFGATLEFLSRENASQLIDALHRKLNSNGHAEPTGLEQAAG